MTLTVQLSCASSVVNMAAPLTRCAKDEQRAVIWCLCTEGVTGAEIHCGVLPQQSVYEWINIFKSVTEDDQGAVYIHE